MGIEESTPSTPDYADAVLTPVIAEVPVEAGTGQGPSSIRQRLVSLDALRGFDMFWIVGGDRFFRALMKWGDWSFSPVVIEQLDHVAWEGFRFYDMIFPLF